MLINETTGLFYSIGLGPLHFITLDTSEFTKKSLKENKVNSKRNKLVRSCLKKPQLEKLSSVDYNDKSLHGSSLFAHKVETSSSKFMSPATNEAVRSTKSIL